MKRSVIGWIAAVVLAVGAAAFAYVFWFAGGSGEPSTELTTPELTGESPTTEDPTSAVGTQYVIEPEQSTAGFTIQEVLRGEPNTVVGTTGQVAGQMVVDPTDLGETQFSTIVVNARTFATDSSQRDRLIRGPVILNSASDEFELITFTPTGIEGLTGMEATVGATYQFQVSGDLVIKGVTQNVTFDVSVEMTDASTISGVATTEVLRSDFGIGIPSVPTVADVTDEVGITLEFVATNA